MDSSSQRRSSFPRSSTSYQEQQPIVEQQQQFVPHVFDFISLAQDAKKFSQHLIPETYLQSYAVDTSKVLGYGASFIATVRKLPPADPDVGPTINMGGLLITARTVAKPRPTHIVYKIARIEFQETGEPILEHRRALSNVLMELQALTHPPLLAHPNIINFLDLAWGSNPFNPSHKLPVIVVEYADQGTLDTVLHRKALSTAVRRSLCLDVALGLDILHQCGIIHGDVKTENVLVFSHPQKRLHAKISDFGFSVVEAVEPEMILKTGTWPWKAPEFGHRVPKELLKQSDVYSLGLLIWTVALDGNNPFDLVVTEEENKAAEIERIKATDALLNLSKLANWYENWCITGRPVEKDRRNDSISLETTAQHFRALTLSASEEPDVLKTSQKFLGRETTDASIPTTLRIAKTDEFYGLLDQTFEYSLTLDPRRRNLEAVIDILKFDTTNSETYEA